HHPRRKDAERAEALRVDDVGRPDHLPYEIAWLQGEPAPTFLEARLGAEAGEHSLVRFRAAGAGGREPEVAQPALYTPLPFWRPSALDDRSQQRGEDMNLRVGRHVEERVRVAIPDAGEEEGVQDVRR